MNKLTAERIQSNLLSSITGELKNLTRDIESRVNIQSL
jgi:hypothetical protein